MIDIETEELPRCDEEGCNRESNHYRAERRYCCYHFHMRVDRFLKGFSFKEFKEPNIHEPLKDGDG